MSTTRVQCTSMSSASSRFGARRSDFCDEDLSRDDASASSRSLVSLSCSSTAGLLVFWKLRSSAAIRLADLVVATRAAWTFSWKDLKF